MTKRNFIDSEFAKDHAPGSRDYNTLMNLLTSEDRGTLRAHVVKHIGTRKGHRHVLKQIRALVLEYFDVCIGEDDEPLDTYNKDFVYHAPPRPQEQPGELLMDAAVRIYAMNESCPTEESPGAEESDGEEVVFEPSFFDDYERKDNGGLWQDEDDDEWDDDDDEWNEDADNEDAMGPNAPPGGDVAGCNQYLQTNAQEIQRDGEVDVYVVLDSAGEKIMCVDDIGFEELYFIGDECLPTQIEKDMPWLSRVDFSLEFETRLKGLLGVGFELRDEISLNYNGEYRDVLAHYKKAKIFVARMGKGFDEKALELEAGSLCWSKPSELKDKLGASVERAVVEHFCSSLQAQLLAPTPARARSSKMPDEDSPLQPEPETQNHADLRMDDGKDVPEDYKTIVRARVEVKRLTDQQKREVKIVNEVPAQRFWAQVSWPGMPTESRYALVNSNAMKYKNWEIRQCPKEKGTLKLVSPRQARVRIVGGDPFYFVPTFRILEHPDDPTSDTEI